MNISLNKLPLLFLLCNLNFVALGQYREHSFNAPGNDCYIEKLGVFAPNGNLSATKRPYIFILDEKGTTAEQAYERDSLHLDLRFYNYKFVYLPNIRRTGADIAQCLSPLTDLITQDYACGKTNVFLVIYDTTYTESMLQGIGLSNTFHSIRIIKSTKKNTASLALKDDFQEDREAYSATPVHKNDIGTYYVEEEKNPDPTSTQGSFIQAEKTYFGPPSSYNFTLSGIIRDRKTGESLPFSNVKTRGTNSGAIANMDGQFTLFNVPSDTSVLIVSYSGYNSLEIYLTPDMSKQNMVIELWSSIQLIDEVKVVADRQDIVLSKSEDVGVIKM